MLIVNYKKVMGQITIEQNETKYHIDINKCNAFCAFTYVTLEEKGKCKNLYLFFADETHAQRCLGIKAFNRKKENICKDIKSAKLNIFYPEMKKLATYFAKANIKVQIYYKEV